MKKTMSLLALAGTMMIGGLGAATAAQAASPTLCPASKVCLFQNVDYGALLGYRAGGGGLLNVSTASNDKTSSWSNKSKSTSAWYFDANGKGTCRTMPAGQNNSWVGTQDNDNLTSWKTNGGC